MKTTLVMLFVAVAVSFLWRSTMAAKESAVRACKSACRSYDVQLLDDTVALLGIALVRTPRQLVTLRRVYGFEFSQSGTERKAGTITLLGDGLETIHLEDLESPLEREASPPYGPT